MGCRLGYSLPPPRAASGVTAATQRGEGAVHVLIPPHFRAIAALSRCGVARHARDLSPGSETQPKLFRHFSRKNYVPGPGLCRNV